MAVYEAGARGDLAGEDGSARPYRTVMETGRDGLGDRTIRSTLTIWVPTSTIKVAKLTIWVQLD